MKFCSFCGKKQIDDPKPFINVFLNGNTSDNRKNNMIMGCVNCVREYKFRRYENGAKTLFALGYKCNKKGKWTYNNKLTRTDLVDLHALEYKIDFLQKENKELKKLLKMNNSK